MVELNDSLWPLVRARKANHQEYGTPCSRPHVQEEIKNFESDTSRELAHLRFSLHEERQKVQEYKAMNERLKVKILAKVAQAEEARNQLCKFKKQLSEVSDLLKGRALSGDY